MRSLKLLGILLYAGLPCIVQAQSSDANPTTPILDARAFRHYSETEIAEIQAHPAKVRQVNYYFQGSYYVKQNPSCPSCPPIDLGAFDVQPYEHLRQMDRENAIQLTQPGNYVVLRPRKEVRATYQILQ